MGLLVFFVFSFVWLTFQPVTDFVIIPPFVFHLSPVTIVKISTVSAVTDALVTDGISSLHYPMWA
jgi:hypothetical protein